MNPSAADIAKKAQAIPFVGQLDAPFKTEFLKTVSYVHVKANSPLISQADECGHLALLLSGSVRVFKVSKDGKEITLYRIHAGESCVLTASCILSNQNFPAFAKSETDCEILLVPQHAVKKWIKSNTLWQEFIFSLTANRLADVIEIVEEVAFKKMDMRLAKHLLSSKNQQQHVESTHQQLASELGSSREVMSRILKDFEHRGLIALNRKNITLVNTNKLAQIAEVL